MRNVDDVITYRHIHHNQGKPTDGPTVTSEAAKVFELSHLSRENGFITEGVFARASLNGGFTGTEMLFRLREPSLAHGKFAAQHLESASSQLSGMQISAAITPEGGFPYPEAVRLPTPDAVAAAAAESASGIDPLLAIASGRANGAAAGAAAGGGGSAATGAANASGGGGGGSGSGSVASSPVGRGSAAGGGAGAGGNRAAATPQKSFRVRLTDHAVFDRSDSGPHKDATKRKIVEFDLQSGASARPAGGVPQDVLLIAREVTDIVLAPNYECEKTQVFGCPPFRLIEEHALQRVLQAAQELFLQDAMVVEVLAPTRVFGDIHGR